MKLTRKSPSKINLFLKITAKLDNGYHAIDTVFLPLDSPCDEITITEIENSICCSDFECENSIKITSSSQNIPCDERNLCWQAVKAYNCVTGAKISCSIHIDKQIPIAAGMGGGSSNAATVISLINEKYNFLDEQALAKLALSLGADVPFFLKPQLSCATGVGEKLIPVDFKYEPLPIIIIAPHFPVSAAWAYSHCKVSEDCGTNGDMERVISAVKESNYDELAQLIRNDLALPLYEKFPILSILKERAEEAGALCCEVSGSGPTMFALCESHKNARMIAKQLSNLFPEPFSVIASYK